MSEKVKQMLNRLKNLGPGLLVTAAFIGPGIAVFLLIVMNQTNLLREFKNGTFENILGGLVVLIAAALGMFQLVKALGVV